MCRAMPFLVVRVCSQSSQENLVVGEDEVEREVEAMGGVGAVNGGVAVNLSSSATRAESLVTSSRRSWIWGS